MLKIKNLESYNGNKVANQFILETSKGDLFQSYESLIALKVNGEAFINEAYYKYSNTTTKYTVLFFNCYDAKDLHNEVKNGSITLLSNEAFNEKVKEVF